MAELKINVTDSFTLVTGVNSTNEWSYYVGSYIDYIPRRGAEYEAVQKYGSHYSSSLGFLFEDIDLLPIVKDLNRVTSMKLSINLEAADDYFSLFAANSFDGLSTQGMGFTRTLLPRLPDNTTTSIKPYFDQGIQMGPYPANTLSVISKGYHPTRVVVTFNRLTLKEALKNGMVAGLGVVSPRETFLAKIHGVRSPEIEKRPCLVVTYQDETDPSTVAAISPSNALIDSSAYNTFKWSYFQNVGDPQTHIDFEYLVNGAWVSVLDKAPWADQSYTFPPGTFAAGETQWRVRAYNNNGDSVSEWSSASVVIKGAPMPPFGITVDSVPRVGATWSAIKQSGYQIQVKPDGFDQVYFDTGLVWGSTKQWRCPEYIPDGLYELWVRVIDSASTFSEWAKISFEIVNQPEEGIELAVSPTNNHGAQLDWATDGTFSGFIVYRNKRPIAKTTIASYTDYFSVGSVTYFIRGVRGAYYSDSNSCQMVLRVKDAVISEVRDINWLQLEGRISERPGHNKSCAPNMKLLHFEGQEKPTVYSGVQNDYTHEFTFTLRTRADYLRLERLCTQKEAAIYKDCKGNKIVGVISKLDVGIGKNYEVSFSMVETQTKDVIQIE